VNPEIQIVKFDLKKLYGVTTYMVWYKAYFCILNRLGVSRVTITSVTDGQTFS